MAFKRWGHTFDGPWPNTDILKEEPGIWVIWHRVGRHWNVLEVGESRNVRQSLLRETRQHPPSNSTHHGEIHYSACYTGKLSDAERARAAQHIHRIARPGK